MPCVRVIQSRSVVPSWRARLLVAIATLQVKAGPFLWRAHASQSRATSVDTVRMSLWAGRPGRSSILIIVLQTGFCRVKDWYKQLHDLVLDDSSPPWGNSCHCLLSVMAPSPGAVLGKSQNPEDLSFVLKGSNSGTAVNAGVNRGVETVCKKATST